jgi:ribonucleotide monophosphatase NagD (HAD superfamily)
MILAIDFDGTLHMGAWPAIGIPTPYAVEVMQKLKQDDHYLIIWTCREGKQQTEMVNWLLEHKIPFDRINDHDPEAIRKYGSDSRKVYAHLYIDDKQIGGLPAWTNIYEYVTKRENMYKYG